MRLEAGQGVRIVDGTGRFTGPHAVEVLGPAGLEEIRDQILAVSGLLDPTIGGSSGPLLPMHVVQPYPTTWNRSSSRYGRRPEASRYSVTT